MKRVEKLISEYHNKKSRISVGNRLHKVLNHKRPKSLVLGVRSPYFLSNRKDKTLHPKLTTHTHTEKGFEIYTLLYYIISKSYPSFEFNQIIVNYNTDFIIHKDFKNKNDNSVMFSLGNFTGGGLHIYDDDKKLVDTLHLYLKPTLFKGKHIYHSTEKFEGERYCVVAYQIKTNYRYDPFTKEVIKL